MFELDGPSAAPHGGGKAERLVILLHGYGADGDDLIGLAQPLGPLFPTVAFHSPNAPYPCDGNPYGRQWFGISRLDPALMLAGARGAAPFVDAFIDAQLRHYGLAAPGDPQSKSPHEIAEHSRDRDIPCGRPHRPSRPCIHVLHPERR